MQSAGTAVSRSTSAEEGYSLIELLVVILIIGVLAAIVIPSFLGEKHKATDAQAKELVRTAQTTAESIGAENDGHYESVTTTELKAVEATIPTTPSTTQAYLSGATGGRSEYSVTVTAADGNEYTIARSAGGEFSRQCTSAAGKKACGGSETSTW